MSSTNSLLVASYERGVCSAVDLVEAMEIHFAPVEFHVQDVGMAGFDCHLMLRAHQQIVENYGVNLGAVKQFAAGYLSAMKSIESL